MAHRDFDLYTRDIKCVLQHKQEGHSKLKTETNIACHKSEGQSAGQLLETGALAEQQKTQQEFLFSLARVEAKYKKSDWL
jgi:hypothetical protein